MKTKDIFDFRRFGKYFASDLRTCAANYGLSLLTIALLTPLANEVFTAVFKIFFTGTWSGPDIPGRLVVFAIAMLCLIVTMPVKCYGKITDKQYGSFWLTLPASWLEKVLSILIMCCLIAPAIGISLYLGFDALLCAIDHTCGQSLASGAVELIRTLGDFEVLYASAEMNAAPEDMMIVENFRKVLEQMTSPWLYIDEVVCMTLPFLLGALCFKTGKTVKTFLALAAVSTAVSMISTPLLLPFMGDWMNMANEEEAARMVFESPIINNLIWIDIISDTMFNCALIAGILFRIKTLKH